ncbi:MAG: choice-of-anchor D domain-containing protein, partial [Bacteroidota bacterium]
MNKRTTLIFILILIFGFQTGSFAQSKAKSAVIYNIYTDGFPWMRATYAVLDSAGKDMRVDGPNDIKITEAGKARAHRPGLSPFCVPAEDKTFSAILLLDASSSMSDSAISKTDATKRWAVVKDAALNFCKQIDTNKTEVAIISFTSVASLQTGFTTNKVNLDKIITGLNTSNGTNYNAAFLVNARQNMDSTQSALWVAKSAKFKPVIIFLTDGRHLNDYSIPPPPLEPRDGRFMVDDVLRLCRERNPSVYVFVIQVGENALDPNDAADNISIGYLQTLAGTEIGKDIYGTPAQNLWMNVKSADELKNTYSYIGDICGKLGYPRQCEVQWLTDCSGGGMLRLNFPNHKNLTASKFFSIPATTKPTIVSSSTKVDFINDNPGTAVTKSVTIRADYNPVEVWGYKSSSTKYKVIDWGTKGSPTFTLQKGESTVITIEYKPTNLQYSSSTIEILGTACNGRLITTTGMSTPLLPLVDMGNVVIKTQKDSLVRNVFCNRTGTSVRINSVTFAGGDGPFFTTVNFRATTLIPGACVNIIFRFQPLTSGQKQCTYEINTSIGKYTQIIKGNSIGDPSISSENPIVFMNTDCKIQSWDTLIKIRNPGPIPLLIDVLGSKIKGADAGEFSLIAPLPPTILPNNSIIIGLSFNPKSAGIKTAELHVLSNAPDNQDYAVILQGTKDSVNFEPDSYLYDFGTLCLGEQKDTTLKISNTGSTDLIIRNISKPPNVFLDTNQIPLLFESSQDLNLSYFPSAEGKFDTTIQYEETFCGVQKTIRVTGNVYEPRISGGNTLITTMVGIPKDTTITLTNSSMVNDLKIDSIEVDDTQFQILGTVPVLPAIIPVQGTIEVAFRYIPTDITPVSANLILTGMPCRNLQ